MVSVCVLSLMMNDYVFVARLFALLLLPLTFYAGFQHSVPLPLLTVTKVANSFYRAMSLMVKGTDDYALNEKCADAVRAGVGAEGHLEKSGQR